MNMFFAELLQTMECGQDAVLTIIVSKQGPAPRDAGAWMLVTGLGRAAGSIGGGAVELDAIKLAQSLLKERRCERRDYRLYPDTSNDLDSICGGGVTIYFQFIPWDNVEWRHISIQALERIGARQRSVLLLDLNGGTPALAKQSANDCQGGTGRFAIELFAGERAVIFGAGHCGQALAPVLASVGFCVTVYDDRPDYADPALFPTAERVACGSYLELCQQLELTSEDYIVVMTNGHANDFEVEKQILQINPAYVGVIGSRSKAAAIDAKLRNCGFSKRVIQSVHTPIGLDIGAVTPSEIAVSIAAEMIQVRAEHLKGAEAAAKQCPMCE